MDQRMPLDLLAAQAALQATARLRVATSVLVCFLRSPMNTAHAAWDLQRSRAGVSSWALGRWTDMAGATSDEMLDAFVPHGIYDEIDATLLRWYNGLADGIILPVPDDPRDDAKAAAVIGRLRRSGGD
jgi:alkanesulfonate monooxygenase SsuD/methylene tetrahydromethanopterin reductase-like flavin-dependent oxidoreductase (luciferase family)